MKGLLHAYFGLKIFRASFKPFEKLSLAYDSHCLEISTIRWKVSYRIDRSKTIFEIHV